MTNKLTTQSQKNTLATKSILEQAGQAANKAAQKNIFTDYQTRKSENTLKRHRADLARFTDFLSFAGVVCGDLLIDPQAWRGITWGLVEAFQKWQLGEGYAIGTINARLSTVKNYAKLSAKAGVIDTGELALIKTVTGYSQKEKKHINTKRKSAGISTRRENGSRKKKEAVSLTPAQSKALLNYPPVDTDTGRRDRLLLAIMLRLGLRVGEVEALTVGNFDLKAGELKFYREKVNKTQTHKLDPVTLDAAKEYIIQDAPAIGTLWRGSVKGRGLGKQGMSKRAITKRVKFYGEKIGTMGLSAHDLRHHWATQAARNGTALDRLQDAGGWASLAMPSRYIEAAKIANQGVHLD